MLVLIVLLIFFITLLLIKKFYLRENFEFKNNPKVYYINLDKAKDRNKRFTKKNSDFNLYRIKAITPNDLTNLNIILPTHCKYNTPLELSCSISHLKAMHKAYHQLLDQNDQNAVLIMEDDMFFLKNPDWKMLIESAPKDWEILQLYTFETSVYQEPKNINWVKFRNDMYSTGAYLMNKHSLQKILESFLPEYRNPDWKSIKIIDFSKSKSVCAADFFIYQYMKTYVHTKILLNTEGHDSFIHPDHLDGHRRSINKINELIKSYQDD